MIDIILALTGILITIISSKFLAGLLISTIHTPKIEILNLKREENWVHWKELKGASTPFGIQNNGKYDYRIEIELELVTESGKSWQFKSKDDAEVWSKRMSGPKFLYRKSESRGQSIYLTGLKNGGFDPIIPKFPIKPESEISTITVRVYPYVELNQFKLPRNFSETALSAVSEEFVIVARGENELS